MTSYLLACVRRYHLLLTPGEQDCVPLMLSGQLTFAEIGYRLGFSRTYARILVERVMIKAWQERRREKGERKRAALMARNEVGKARLERLAESARFIAEEVRDSIARHEKRP